MRWARLGGLGGLDGSDQLAQIFAVVSAVGMVVVYRNVVYGAWMAVRHLHRSAMAAAAPGGGSSAVVDKRCGDFGGCGVDAVVA